MTQQRTRNQAYPNVTLIHRRRSITRPGKGFAKSELRQASITISYARKLGVQVDLRRKTAYVANIDLLKAMAKEVRSGTQEPHDERK